MEINDFVQKFAEQFEETESSVFKPETAFKELDEWDSLMSLNIIAMVDEEFNVKVTGDDIRNSKKILDIFEIVKSKA
jgi:acyl carrier protein